MGKNDASMWEIWKESRLWWDCGDTTGVGCTYGRWCLKWHEREVTRDDEVKELKMILGGKPSTLKLSMNESEYSK